MTHQSFNSEARFEDAIVAMLTRYGWEEKVLENPSEQDLLRNWADILFENNRQDVRLGDHPLTDSEMQQLLDKLNSLKTPLAINEFINGGSTSIRRDNTADTHNHGKEVTLKIYNRREIAAGDSRYQIARQPKFPTSSPLASDRRGDLMLLINGMPVIHIELKRSGVDVSQASNQIEKYSREGVFSRGVLSLVQIFVAMTPEETLYFANPGRDGRFDKQFFFHWADFENEPVNDWEEIVKRLLSIPMAHQLIGFYTVPDTRDGVLKVMRSYQYYAANAIRNKVESTHWDERSVYGGFVWHTTGSGKTMTSFKSAQLISQGGDADKVVFLMDRIELGTQSLDEYRGFAGDNDNVEGTENTEVLVRKLESDSPDMRLIVTSIQKMGLVHDTETDSEGIISGFPKIRLDKIRAKRIVFIIDECHRSTFGDTLARIKANFPGALYFGFTGTPIDKENNVRDMTTRDLFGERLHLYTIGDGIRDGNVLGFDPVKVRTMRDDEVAHTVALHAAKASSAEEALADDAKKETYMDYMNRPMVYKEPDPLTGRYPDGIEDLLPESTYLREEHREKVVEDILRVWTRVSAGGRFHAILATSSIPEAIEYYRLLRVSRTSLKVTAVFDPTIDNCGTDRAILKEGAMEEILADYNDWFGTSFKISNWQNFKKDVAARMAHKRPYLNPERERQLDIMIVVDQMLTGFDSKYVSTLFLDKVLAYENLIQAFSRTNRLYGHEKRHGMIRYYRRPNKMERNIENAFRLYAHGKPEGIFVVKLGDNIKAMNRIFKEIERMFAEAGASDFASLPSDTSTRAKFAKEWRVLNAHLDAAKMQGFTWKKRKHTWKDEKGRTRSATMVFDEKTYLILAQRYRELFAARGGGKGGSAEVPYEIEPYLLETSTGHIDTNYMNSRFKKFLDAVYDNAELSVLDSVRRELHASFAHLPAEDQKYAGRFLNDLEGRRIPRGKIDPRKTLHDYIWEMREADKEDRIRRFATAIGIDEDALRHLISLHLPDTLLNQGGYFAELFKTLDKGKAAELLTRLQGGKAPLPFQVTAMAEALIRDFITKGAAEMEPDLLEAVNEIFYARTPQFRRQKAADNTSE